jgi:type I restriction enzyme R subunit
VYATADIEKVVERFLTGRQRTEIDPVLDACTVKYAELEEEQQIRFKADAKAFVRTYDFLGSILPYSNAEWERLSIFLNLLVAKLPAPKGTDLSKGILDAIDMDSYRAEKKATEKIILADEDAEIDPVPAGHVVGKPEPELDKLSKIIKTFNDLFGNIPWADKDRIGRVIGIDIPARVNEDERYQNAKKNSDKENARVEHDRALDDAINERMSDEAELFAKFFQDPLFKQWLRDMIFDATYDGDAA